MVIHMNDPNILKLFEKRDEQAIKECQKAYSFYCHCIALRILDSNEDAEECVNDALHRAWNAIPPARPASLATWLGTVTRNIAIDRYRQKHSQKRGSGDISIAFQEIEEVFSAGGTPDDALDRKELAKTFNHFLATLSERDRNILLARYHCLYPVKDIAKQYGKSEKYVRVILTRTLEKLKKLLEKENEHEYKQ